MKKIYVLLGICLSFLSSFVFSIANASVISLPSDFTTNIGSSTTDTLSAFSPYIILIIGILLAGVVLEIIIGAIRHH
jgi:hypothetical protein